MGFLHSFVRFHTMTHTSHERAHCNACGSVTQCDLLCREDKPYRVELSEDNAVDCFDRYEMLRCRGCTSIIFRHKYWDESSTTVDGVPLVHEVYYPPATSRYQPTWYLDLLIANDYLYALLSEIYVAVNNDAKSLALMGIRALLEAIMLNAVGDSGSFSKNLKRFREEGFVSNVQESLIKKTLEAGHAAIHRKFEPRAAEVIACLDIAENLLESLIILPQAGEELSKRVPQRGPR